MKNVCRICENSENNRLHTAREMMLGMRDAFDYLECGSCGTLQICETPDLQNYYPQNYYSLDPHEEIYIAQKMRRRVAARFAGKYFLKGNGLLGRSLVKRAAWLENAFPDSLKEPLLSLNFNSKILDFGCGNGKLLQTLHYFGFHHLMGADAFIEKEIVYPTGVKILKRSLTEIEPSFDLVMLHHSFEHLPNPPESLIEINRLLPVNKFCLIRLPVVSFAWEKYGVNWFQLDAPRHLFLYTEKSFRTLAEKAGFAVEKVVYDSEAVQFYISEQYAHDIAMHDARAFRGDFSKSIFTEIQMREWERETARLNAENLGDQACFYLRKL